MELERLTNSVVKLSQEVANFIHNQSKLFKTSDVEEKGAHDLVSYVDRTAEEMILKGLASIFPEAGFLAEESGKNLAEIYNWIVDPLDGTTNFVHGIPLYAISIALQQNQETIAGVVLEVNLNECFYAWKSGPAYLNGKQIQVSKTTRLTDSLIATGFPYADFSKMNAYLGLFNELMRTTRGLRRLGSAAVDLAYVACGRFDVFYEYGLKPWDMAAGAFIVEQAGGKLSGFDGSQGVVFGKDIIASNGLTHDEMLKITGKYF
jgi:myo-inositol-1(or 4)-monophosphatase